MSTPSGAEPDPRPRPQYGEYATPEQQRASIREPVREAMPVPVAPSPGGPTPAGPTPAAAAPAARRSGTVDRIVTVLLLVFGLVNVASSVPALLDYDGYVASFLDALGVDGALADPAAGAPWGIAAALVLVVGLVAAAALSRASLRRGHITFWIPLVAAVVVNLIAAFLAIVPIVGDAALWASIQSALLG